jgi:D-glycero-D-manno-heptose 1,7-bisphosphate phosphatase
MGIDPLKPNRAVFLDRDGVINANVLNPNTGEWESPLTADQLRLAQGAAGALKRLRDAGYRLIVVSNQPNYAKGKATLEDLAAIHAKMVAELEAAGAALDEAHYCYHHPDGLVPDYSGVCVCRKPSPHFLELASGRYGIDLANSWMVGDRATDIACGKAAGTCTILIRAADQPLPKAADPQPDHSVADLAAAAEIILRG